MGNYSTDSFPTNRWSGSDALSNLSTAIASVDASIRHAFGFSVNTLTAPFDIGDDGAIVVQTSLAIGTSNAMIDVVDSISASAGANEDQKLATIAAIRLFMATEYVQASAITANTDNFDGHLSAADDTVQKALDTLDDVDLSIYLPLAGGTMTGDLIIDYGPSLQVKVGAGEAVTDAVTGGSFGITYGAAAAGTFLVGSAARPLYNAAELALLSDLDAYLPLAGGTMTGHLYMDGTTSPKIRVRENGDDASFLNLMDSGDEAVVQKIEETGDAHLVLAAVPSDGTGAAQITMFRATNTTGDRLLTMHLGNGGSTVQHEFNVGTGDIDLCKQAGILSVGDTGNTVDISPEGVYLNGTSTMWDDLRVPMTALFVGSSAPGFAQAFDDSGGTSAGVYVQWFSPTSEEQLFFTAQLPHTYAEGTDIEVHVHWISADTAAGAGTDVSWGLEYTWANINGDFGDTVIIYGDEQTNGASETLTVGKHYITEIATIDGTGKTMSSMIVGRVFRDATGTGGTDDYDDDAGLLEIDFHYEINSFGSMEEYTKGPS